MQKPPYHHGGFLLPDPFPIRRTILVDTRAQPHYTRAQAQAVVQKLQPMEHVRIQKGEQSMGSAYVQLTAAVDEKIRKVKTAGQDLPWHEAADRVHKRQLGAYVRALADAPVLKMTPAPEMPVMKMSTAAQALDMIATAKISEGLPHAQAYEEAGREHPSLSLESRGGEPWKIA